MPANGESHRGVEGDGTLVDGRGDRPDDASLARLSDVEEPRVEVAAQAGAAEAGADAGEMDVRGVRDRRGQEADEEAGQVAVALGDDAGAVEVIEEQPGQSGMDHPSPPVVHDRHDAVIVGRLGGAETKTRFHGSRTTPGARTEPAACGAASSAGLRAIPRRSGRPGRAGTPG